MSDHVKSGRYYAVCRSSKAEQPPYVRVFDFEEQHHADGQQMTAEWFFLNRLDPVSCLEFLIPEAAFKGIAIWDKFDNKFVPATISPVRKKQW
jgi:hypothetical protein